MAPAPLISICSAKRFTKDSKYLVQNNRRMCRALHTRGDKSVIIQNNSVFLKRRYLFSKKTHQWPEATAFSFLEGTHVPGDVRERAQLIRIGDF